MAKRKPSAMDNAALTLIFDRLQNGHLRAGWAHTDYAEIQTVGDSTDLWARRIDAALNVGLWTLLPPPIAGHA